MAIPSIYINLEDDVEKITTRLKRTSARQVVLVCPKRCFLFSDSVNLTLLKKQADLLGQEIFILTMDERGQLYARQAGFGLKFLPKSAGSQAVSDIRPLVKKAPVPQAREAGKNETGFAAAVRKILPLPPRQQPVKLNLAESPKIEIAKTAEPAAAAPALEQPVESNDTIFPADFEQTVEQEKSKSRSHKVLAGFTAVCLIVLLLLLFVVLPQATVAVYPKTEPVTRDMQVSVSPNIKQPDSDKLVLPGTEINQSLNLSGQFNSQGKKQVGNKAEGTVVIYNFTGVPINLKAQTTTLTAAGKTYNLVTDVTSLRPTTYSNAKTKEVNPNSLAPDVEIVASDGGDDYNLPAGTRLEITNQVFGSRPLYLYAKSDSEISGGTTRYLSVIQQSDVDSAKSQLQAQAIDQIRQSIQPQGLALPDNAYSVNVTSFTTDSPVGAQTPVFNASLTAQVLGLAFNQGDLKNMVLGRIEQTLAANKTLQSTGPDEPEYQVQNWDVNNQLAVLSVHFEGQEVFNLNLSEFPSQLTGKNVNQVTEILQSNEAIDKVEITLAPSWQKSFPLFSDKIKIVLGNPNASN